MLRRLSGGLTNSGGFIYLEALFLVMILSVAALFVMHGFQMIMKVNRDAAVRTVAIHLANAQIAEMQYLADTEEFPAAHFTVTETFENVLGSNVDGRSDRGMTVEFNIAVDFENEHAEVTVIPTVNGVIRDDLQVKAERDIFKH